MGTRSNEEWISALQKAGPEQEAALSDLHATILAGLPYALSKYLSSDNPNFESLAENTAQETLLRAWINWRASKVVANSRPGCIKSLSVSP